MGTGAISGILTWGDRRGESSRAGGEGDLRLTPSGGELMRVSDVRRGVAVVATARVGPLCGDFPPVDGKCCSTGAVGEIAGDEGGRGKGELNDEVGLEGSFGALLGRGEIRRGMGSDDSASSVLVELSSSGSLRISESVEGGGGEISDRHTVSGVVLELVEEKGE